MMRIMNRRRTRWICALAVASPVVSVHADLPLVSGNYSIARQFLHGDAHIVIVGDSEQNGLYGYYPSILPIDRWTGVVVGPGYSTGPTGNTGVYQFGFGGSYIATSTEELTDTTDPIAAGAAPDHTQVITFHAQTAPATSTLLDNRIFELGFTPDQPGTFHGGNFADTSIGTLHADAIVYANPTGIASGVTLNARINSIVTPVASAPINANSSAPGLIKVPLTFPAQAWTGSNHLTTSFNMTGGTTPPEGSNLVIAGVRYYNGDPGFQLTNFGQGGEGIDFFINGANRHLDQYFQNTDTNMAYIWVGQNNVSTYDGPTFKSKMLQLISQYKAARPNMKFVLVSTYDTGSPVLADYAQDLYDISQSDPSVLFLNLYKSAGSFSYLDSTYLADHIHENAAGDVYMANQIAELLQTADLMAPKLAGDANLDNVVNTADFTDLAQHFGRTNAYLAIGDLNADGVVNALDFNVLAKNFGATVDPVPTQTVAPEPCMIGAGILLMLQLSRRLRRNAI
jgi:hypothetical protein